MHGILVQLPLPQHINEQRVLERIEVHKDVDGYARVGLCKYLPMLAVCDICGGVCESCRLHPLNVAKLANTNTRAASGARNTWDFTQLDFNVSCTPQVSQLCEYVLCPHLHHIQYRGRMLCY